MILYLRERWLRRRPEAEIWSVVYQRRFWQDVIHGAHSLPLAAAGALIAHAAGGVWAASFFASVFLHALCDLPVHVHDAHRHFLPFSHYRFKSRISYWDVRYHGRGVALAEAWLVTACAVYLAAGDVGVVARVSLALVVVFYAASYWRSFVRRPAAGAPSGTAL